MPEPRSCVRTLVAKFGNANSKYMHCLAGEKSETNVFAVPRGSCDEPMMNMKRMFQNVYQFML